MTTISEVAGGIYQIRMDEKDPPGWLRSSCIYLIVAEKQLTLIESGLGVVVPTILNAIRQLGHDPSRLSYIILTHIHIDHAGGAGPLVRQFPQLQVVVHQRGARHLIDPSRLIEATRQAWGARFEDEYGPILPIPEQQVRAVEEGDVILLGDKELKIIYAPGHATHQMCLYETKSQGVFCGDSISTSAVAGFDLDATLETIDKLSALNPKIIFVSHGIVIQETAKYLQSVRSTAQAYGEIILEAIKAGEDNEKITQMLETYQKEHSSSDNQPGRLRFNNVITWYVAHFKRKGVI